MTKFEVGVDRMKRIYQAGICGAPMPKFAGFPIRDAQELYSAGYEDSLDEVAAAHDPEIWRDTPFERFIRNL